MSLQRRGDRPVVVAFVTLMLAMAAHALLESARDALLFRSLSTRTLLWTYVATAGVALLTMRSRGSPLSLPRLLASGAVATCAFWVLLARFPASVAFVFYVFTSAFATLMIPRFWLALSASFTLRRAKKHYALVGVGGIVGAVVGSAAAALLLRFLAPRHLVVLGAGVFVGASFVARLLPTGVTPSAVTDRPRRQRQADSQSYLRRLTLLGFCASAALTVSDYLFKSVVAETVPSGELAAYFARTYTAINAIALVVQLFVVPRVLRRAGTRSAAAVLPALLLCSTGAFAFLGAPMLVILGKGIDGSLRNSLHRVAVELLYFPLSEEARSRWKMASDALGQRGGQALGAAAVLGLLALGTPRVAVAVLATGLVVAWLGIVLSTQRPYLELFREGLRRGAVSAQVPASSAETLRAVLEAFSSPNDLVVCAAMEFLARNGNAELIPSALVHHPSSDVGLRALEVIGESRRVDIEPICRRLARHPDAGIRAEALRIRVRLGIDEPTLLAAVDDDALEVQTTALLAMPARSGDVLAIARGDSAEAKFALARALRRSSMPSNRDAVVALLGCGNVDVLREALAATVNAPDARYLPHLRALLAERRLLAEIRTAIVASAGGRSEAIAAWLDDETLPRSIRRNVPRILSAFGAEAFRSLLGRFARERDGAVRFRILRAMGRLRSRDPSMAIDARALEEIARGSLERARTLLGWRLAQRQGEATNRLEALLSSLLLAKERHALERVFRVLDILHPEAELESVWYSLSSAEASAHDAALEIVEELAPASLPGLAAMLDAAPDEERWTRAGNMLAPTREVALASMCEDRSLAIHEVARRIVEDARASR